ncbi:LacI family DNA-binding transcriptional regulator [candidate division KSB1 bacterium]|nr:LacI family DNA-binding transcriptional regulator [candidate division KSB1 bacterium]
MNPTIKDVAEKAGVSLSTVSLVINRKKNVSEETTRKVQQAIVDLNYHPRRLAQGLASRRTGNIGFILSDDHFSRAEPFYTKIFLGCEFEARNHNYYILLTTVQDKFTSKSIPRFLPEKNVDGIIVAGKVPAAFLDSIRDYQLPLLFIDYLPLKDIGKYSAVLIDNEDGALQAVNHLIKAGHRHIAFIGGDIKHPSIRSRLEGYKQAFKKSNLPLKDQLIICDEPYTAAIDGYNAMCKLLHRTDEFSAIFAANDAMAFGCLTCLREKKYQVPAHVSLVGFDDVDVATQMEPHLTTIRVNKEEIGAIAVKHIVDMIVNEKKTVGKIYVPVELIVRNSTISRSNK